ncbi:hypothetical protein TSAR_009958 [Trichomalopsis sarcophagae]|uniref:Uncharacterized protein n=1 Tax=Trichomalopsis sarcophagae TaxID=543379 RepID=A0A232ENI7_9HYME|nr:hypothetical protein TSAR_009958 [Trichomalopsis sarcophagae]
MDIDRALRNFRLRDGQQLKLMNSENAQPAKVRKSRLFVTKIVLIRSVRLAHERSECDKHGTLYYK